MEKISVENYERKISELRNELNSKSERLSGLLREQNRAKNSVAGGYYMMSRKAEQNLRALQLDNPTASLIFSVMREHMQIGTNALTISNTALQKIVCKSRATITRAVSYLSKNNYVQIVKAGNVNTYVVNERVAFAGTPNQRKAVFSATLVAHEVEQEEGWEDVKKLKAVPEIYSEEEIIY